MPDLDKISICYFFLFVLTRTQLEVYKLLLADTQKIILLIKKKQILTEKTIYRFDFDTILNKLYLKRRILVQQSIRNSDNTSFDWFLFNERPFSFRWELLNQYDLAVREVTTPTPFISLRKRQSGQISQSEQNINKFKNSKISIFQINPG